MDTAEEYSGSADSTQMAYQNEQQESGEKLYMCLACSDRFSSGAALEAHMTRTEHYSISAHSEQPQTAHGPMQQLAQQVQRILASFNSQHYRPDQTVDDQNAYAPQTINMLDSCPFSILNNLSDNPDVNHYSGPQVKLTPVGQSASPQASTLPNLPPGIQLQKRPAQQNLENSQPKQRREEMPANPSVKLPSTKPLVWPSQQSTPPKKSDNSIAVILTNRGITKPNASRGLPTVDLPSDPDHPTHHPMQQLAEHTQQHTERIRNRTPIVMTPPRRQMRVSCQVCDKVFNSQETLNQHLRSHRGIHYKLQFECKQCPAQYPTARGLALHKEKYHKTSSTALDMAIPVVDLKQNGVVHKLALLGVRNFIPLAQLHNQENTGQFCLPIVSVELANNPAFCNISGISASNLLPIGPLRNIPP